jgi:hypothetical protein
MSPNIRIYEIHNVLTSGEFDLSVFPMLTSMRKIVTRSAILPGTISTGTMKPMNETRTMTDVGMYMLMTYWGMIKHM